MALCLAFVVVVATSAFGGTTTWAARPELPPLVEAPTSSFLETFSGKPTNPLPWNHRDWDVFQTSRDIRSWAAPDPVDAHHAFSNCGDVASGGSHHVDSWSETVFQCNDHIMTSINGTPGYGAIYLSPPAMTDFSGGSSTIGFDVSTFVSSSRDWLDVLITPFADAMSYPFRSDLEVDGSGLPRNAIHIEQSFGSSQWEIELIRNGSVSTLGTLAIPYGRIGGASKVTRTPVRIVIRSTSLTLSYPTVSGWSRTVSFASLSWTQGIVQFGHHSYTPLKDCQTTPQFVCAANTWHWDNISINPSRPFYQWQATPERTGAAIRDSNPRTLTFGKPAPTNALLVFSANCGVQVRDTPSSAWRSATIMGPNAHPEHTQSNRVTVRPGATSIQFRFVNNSWYGPGYGCQLSNPVVKAPGPPTGSELLTWDQASGAFAVRTMTDWVFQLKSQGSWSTVYDDVVAGDFDRDGISDDYFVWDAGTGNWVIQTLVSGVPTYRNRGTWSRVYDQFIVGDFDSDGFLNDMIVWDNNTGNFVVQSFGGFQPVYRRRGTYATAYDTIVVGDWDGDGRMDDAMIWSEDTGFWVVHSFSAFQGIYRSRGQWASAYDRAYAGDWDRDGARDDLLLWDDGTGNVVVQTFAAYNPVYRGRATFSSTLDIAATADLDGDGRFNEIFVFDRDARAWQVHRFVSFVPQLARAGTFTVSYDVAWG
jgi:hypothetical protein